MHREEPHTRYIKRPRKQAMIVIVVIFAYVSAFYYLHFKPPARASDSLAAVAAAIERAPATVATSTKSADCRVRGSLPDPECTPGATFTDTPLETICTDGYSAGVRDVPASLKKKIYKSYGIAYPQPFGSYELDHLVPLSIGGSNEPANLFPEAASPPPGFREKDIVENYLHIEVCKGAIKLDAAQRAIAADWTAVYAAISPADREAIERAYGSWAERKP